MTLWWQICSLISWIRELSPQASGRPFPSPVSSDETCRGWYFPTLQTSGVKTAPFPFGINVLLLQYVTLSNNPTLYRGWQGCSWDKDFMDLAHPLPIKDSFPWGEKYPRTGSQQKPDLNTNDSNEETLKKRLSKGQDQKSQAAIWRYPEPSNRGSCYQLRAEGPRGGNSTDSHQRHAGESPLLRGQGGDQHRWAMENQEVLSLHSRNRMKMRSWSTSQRPKGPWRDDRPGIGGTAHRNITSLHLSQWLSHCGPRASNPSLTWEPVTNANSQAHPRPTKWATLGVGPRKLY